MTPLMLAAKEGNNVLIEELLAKGANIDDTDNEGYTALHYAAKQKKESAYELLITRNAKENLKTKDGKSAKDLLRYGAQKWNQV